MVFQLTFNYTLLYTTNIEDNAHFILKNGNLNQKNNNTAMNKLILILLISLSSTILFGQNEKVLSDAKISFTFVSKKVNGTISGFSSTSKIDKDNLTNSIFKGSVKTETLDTGNFLRNWSLKGGKYFDADNYPMISFESTSIEKNKNGITVKGQLTIKDSSKPISISFIEVDNRLEGTTTLFSSDFGIEIIKKSRDDNKVVVKMSFKIE